MIDNPYDIDRNGRVDLGDVIQARNHRSTIDLLELISVPTSSQLSPPAASPMFASVQPIRHTSPFAAAASPLHTPAAHTDTLLGRMRAHTTTFGVDALLDGDEDDRSPLLVAAHAFTGGAGLRF